MDRNKETFETWNNIASLYEDKFMDIAVYNDTYSDFCQAVGTTNAKILEIGCGPGNITKYLLSKRPDFEVFGIDIAPNMVELARKNNPTARFAVMDCRQISDLNESYHGIIGGFCLPYLSQTESIELITSAYRLLNENGMLYLSFVEGDPHKSEFKTGSGGRVYFHYYDLEDVKAQLIKATFEDIKTYHVKYPTSDTEFDMHTIPTAKKQTTFN